MKLSDNPSGTDSAARNGQSEEQTLSLLERANLTAPPASPAKLSRPGVKRRRILRIMSVILLITLIFALVRLTSILSATDDQLRLSLGSQGTALVDLGGSTLQRFYELQPSHHQWTAQRTYKPSPLSWRKLGRRAPALLRPAQRL